ncbi:hypothetical protein CspHIS471_0400710 [Cutaneotrichosporon sp. HIS471]|nr:hypothetical protein CspHIS471_0400710 [Cutaneotrichosporon sp. HIS471]
MSTKWKKYFIEVMLPTTPAIIMFISGIIFSWDAVADGTPRLVGWLIMFFFGLGFSALLFAFLYRRHAYIFAASFHMGPWYNLRLIAIELFLIACLDTSGWLLGYYEANPLLPKTDRRHWYLAWGVCLAFTLFFWGTLVGWLLYLLRRADCIHDRDGSALPWSFFKRASVLPEAQQAALAGEAPGMYYPDIQHIPNAWRNSGRPVTEWQSSTFGPHPNRLYNTPHGTMTPQGLGFKWQRPIGAAPPRPSRQGARL